MTHDHCSCLVFLTDQPDGRVERYADCPRHWRLADDDYVIPRASAPVDLDDFLELVDA